MTNPATIDDVAARWRPLNSDEEDVVQTLLDDAWFAHVLVRRPTIEADIDAGTVSEAAVIEVLANMVLRVRLNPEGKSQERIDDYSYTRDSSTATGQLYLSADELARITPALPAGTRRNSVRLVAYGEL